MDAFETELTDALRGEARNAPKFEDTMLGGEEPTHSPRASRAWTLMAASGAAVAAAIIIPIALSMGGGSGNPREDGFADRTSNTPPSANASEMPERRVARPTGGGSDSPREGGFADGSSSSSASGAETRGTRELSGADDISRDDLTDERVVEWQRYEVVDDATVRVFFSAGSETCYGTRVIIEETETEVRIATLEGNLPNSPKACPALAREASLVISTTKPIGGREVVPLLDPGLR